MKRYVALLVTSLLLAHVVKGQTTNTPSRPVSAAITNAVIAVSGATNGASGGVSVSLGQAVTAGYLYIATNGQVSVGLGNTLKNIGKGSLKMVTAESVDLPQIVPSNGVVNVTFVALTSQFYAPDKTHLGLGLGVYTMWHVGWMKKLHLGIFQNLQGIELGAGISPDIDQTVKLELRADDTVLFAKAGLKWNF